MPDLIVKLKDWFEERVQEPARGLFDEHLRPYPRRLIAAGVALLVGLSFVLSLLFSNLSGGARVEGPAGGIKGKVISAQGRAMPNVQVTFTPLRRSTADAGDVAKSPQGVPQVRAGTIQARSDASGNFEVKEITPGRYSFDAGNARTVGYVGGSVRIEPGAQATLDIQLEPPDATAD